jgi:hypothetical protein
VVLPVVEQLVAVAVLTVVLPVVEQLVAVAVLTVVLLVVELLVAVAVITVVEQPEVELLVAVAVLTVVEQPEVELLVAVAVAVLTVVEQPEVELLVAVAVLTVVVLLVQPVAELVQLLQVQQLQNHLHLRVIDPPEVEVELQDKVICKCKPITNKKACIHLQAFFMPFIVSGQFVFVFPVQVKL